MNEELRAITKKRRNLDSAVMRSSLIPSEKYSWAGSPHMLSNGNTAMAGRSECGELRCEGLRASSTGGSLGGTAS